MRIALITTLLFAVSALAQPYEPHVIWDRSGLTDSAAYGWQVLPLGDQNNDGYADWAVYAQGNWEWGGSQYSYLEFFHGGSSPDPSPYRVWRADTTLYYPLWFVFGVGDVNGDGYDDWEVRLVPLGLPPTYIVFIFFGGPIGDTIPDVELHIPLGSWCYPLGDFNDDGFDDQYWFNNDGSGRIYFGGSPMDTIPGWKLNVPPPGQIQTVPSAVGDFNGDGASDFLCYNPNPPYNLVVFLGAADADTTPAYFWSNMGYPVGSIGDLNHDDHDDFGLRTANATVQVYFGGDTLFPISNYSLNFPCEAGLLSGVNAGDFNHDTYNDLLLFTETCSDNMFGSLSLYFGHSWLNPNPVFNVEGSWPDGLIGVYAAAGLGDVNGDGLDDFAIGAWDDFAYLGWRGRCVIIAGDTLPVSADVPRPEIPHGLQVNAYPNPFNSEADIEVTTPLSSQLTSLTLFNVLGQSVRHATLPLFSGKYVYHLNAGDMPTGLYLVQVQSGNLQMTQKIMLLR